MDDGQLQLYLRRATGDLWVAGHASSDTYQVYFHIPIPFHEQAPVLIEMAGPQLVDYRFVQEDPPNLVVAARMANAASTMLNWTAWVLVKENSYPNFPTYVPIPTPDELPDSVKPWLEGTDCCQLSAPIVQRKADSLRDTTTNLTKLAQDICSFCHSIPPTQSHDPFACDAVYTLNWGNACTGHAHAAAALLRANGIPARDLLNILVGVSQSMHWIIDYYIPGYGWVRMESTGGVNPMAPQDELVVRACNPGDEYPVWFPYGVDAEWHTSDTAYGMGYPDWGRAHNAFAVLTLSDSSVRVDYAIALTKWVFDRYSAYSGIRLTPAEYAAFASGLSHQTDALARIQASDLPGYIIGMEEALIDYQDVNPAPVETLFSEDFENGPVGWTHGGSQDEWELGTPSFGPVGAHSGQNCWGTNLDGPYANNDDCWLQSPRIDLSGLASANLSFWIWNRVQGHYGDVYDPAWVEISRDGSTFFPLTSWMGGVNDDPEITAVGGWSHVFLDLAQYLGDTVRLRFRFRSDGSVVFAGSYIDDVRITGRRASSGIAETPNVEVRTAKWLPTVVRCVLCLKESTSSSASPSWLLDVAGRKVLGLRPGANDVRPLAPGVYFVRSEPTAASREPSGVFKVVIQR
jgi:transglutaminase-like putative cysteine protease